MKKSLSQFGTKELIKKDGGTLVQQELIKNQITIIPELESLIPPLHDEEFKLLESNILKEGCREPLLVWQTPAHTVRNTDDTTSLYVLIDGHNRYNICSRHGISFRILLKEFPTIEEVRSFMIDNQLGRRNLTPEQMSYLRGQKYLSLKKDAGRPTGTTDGRRTEEVLADQFNVSPKTIRIDAEFAKGLEKTSSALKKDILTRKTKVNKGDIVKLADVDTADESIDSVEKLNATLKRSRKAASVSEPSAEIRQLKRLVEQLEVTGPSQQSLQEIIRIAQNLLQN